MTEARLFVQPGAADSGAPQIRVRWWGRSVALATTLMLAACQTIVPRGPVDQQPTGPAPSKPRPSTEVEPGLPRDTARHRVALLVPLSGSNAGVGQSIANATMMALLDAQADTIRITNYDTTPGAAAAAQKAIAEGAQLILGPLLSEDVRAVAPIARAARVPVISFSNDSGVAGGGTYLMGYTPAQSIERVVDYARGARRHDLCRAGPQRPVRRARVHRVPARGRRGGGAGRLASALWPGGGRHRGGGAAAERQGPL